MILVCILAMLAIYWFAPHIAKRKELLFVGASIAILILYASLRAHHLQPDIPIYVRYYEIYAERTYDEIISIFNSDVKDPFYYFVGWLFSRVFRNAQFWLAAVAIFYNIAIGVFVYRESNNPLISIIAFISLTYFEFSLSGLRQTIAMGFIVLSYFSLKYKRLKEFLILVLIASLFHKSALIFLIVYPIAHFKVGKTHLAIAIVALALFFSGQSYIRDFLMKYLEDTQYEGYIDRTVGLTFSGFIIQLAIFIFCLLYYSAVVEKHKHANVLYNLAFLGLIFQLFSSMIAEIFRVSMYFSIFNIALIPLAISAEGDKKMRSLEMYSILGVLIFYILLTGIPRYEVFW